MNEAGFAVESAIIDIHPPSVLDDYIIQLLTDVLDSSRSKLFPELQRSEVVIMELSWQPMPTIRIEDHDDAVGDGQPFDFLFKYADCGDARGPKVYLVAGIDTFL